MSMMKSVESRGSTLFGERVFFSPQRSIGMDDKSMKSKTMLNFNSKINLNLYVKRIVYILKNRNLSTEDAFYELLGTHESKLEEPKMSYDDFTQVLKKLEIKVLNANVSFFHIES